MIFRNTKINRLCNIYKIYIQQEKVALKQESKCPFRRISEITGSQACGVNLSDKTRNRIKLWLKLLSVRMSQSKTISLGLWMCQTTRTAHQNSIKAVQHSVLLCKKGAITNPICTLPSRGSKATPLIRDVRSARPASLSGLRTQLYSAFSLHIPIGYRGFSTTQKERPEILY